MSHPSASQPESILVVSLNEVEIFVTVRRAYIPLNLNNLYPGYSYTNASSNPCCLPLSYIILGCDLRGKEREMCLHIKAPFDIIEKYIIIILRRGLQEFSHFN